MRLGSRSERVVPDRRDEGGPAGVREDRRGPPGTLLSRTGTTPGKPSATSAHAPPRRCRRTTCARQRCLGRGRCSWCPVVLRGRFGGRAASPVRASRSGRNDAAGPVPLPDGHRAAPRPGSTTPTPTSRPSPRSPVTTWPPVPMSTPADAALLDRLLRTAVAEGVTEFVVGAVIAGADGRVRQGPAAVPLCGRLPGRAAGSCPAAVSTTARASPRRCAVRPGRRPDWRSPPSAPTSATSTTSREAAGRPGGSTSPPLLPPGRPSRSPSTTSVCGPTASSRRGPAVPSGASWPPGGTEPPPESPSAGARR